MEQPDVRIDPLDQLTVQLHHQPQHPVRGRVLRPEVDRVVRDLGVAGGRIGRVGPVGDVVEEISHNQVPPSRWG